MCGIAGAFLLEREPGVAIVASVLRMLDTEAHRGPNDWGLLLPEAVAARPEVRTLLEPRGLEHVRTYPGVRGAPGLVLGARRLSIIDLSPRGRMPMGTRERRLWIAYNGEIYNFRELRDDLRRRGHVFDSETDTEVVLHGYAEWGREVVSRLQGMFAFVVFDARVPDAPRVFLGRDRFGIKPMYWARRESTLCFASEVRPLVASGVLPNEPEPRGFHGFLVHGSVPSPWTTVRDVFSLPAAHTLSVDRPSYSHPRPARYWRLPAASEDAVPMEEAVVETRARLDDAVRRHLVSDVPLGVFLSGGLDSSAVTALAARHLGQALTTVSVTFDESAFSEGDHAERVARRFGAKHVDVRVRATDFAAEMPRIFAAMDQPSIDGVNTYFIAKAAREAGLTVVLSGLGADEIFWGYSGFRIGPRIDRAARLPGVRWIAGLVARLAARHRASWEKLDFLREGGPLAAYLAVRGLFPPDRAARILGAGRLPLSAPAAAGPLTAARYGEMEAEHYLQDQLLRDTDVFAMAHSVEVRVPFLDHHLTEYVAALPPALKRSREVNKPLLHAVVAPYLGEETLSRRKMGFTFPFQDWMREVDVPVTETPALTLNPREVARVRGTFRAGTTHWSRTWALSVLAGMASRGRLPSWRPGRGPRRLLFLLSEVYGAKGGIQSYNQSLLRAAGEAFPAAEIRVISATDTAMPPAAAVAGRAFFFGCGPRTSRLRKVRMALRAVREVIGHRPDELICGHINVAPLAGALRWAGIARVSLVAHGIDAWSPPAHLRAAACRIDRVLAVSRYTAARMRAWGVAPARLTVLPDTVDGEVFRPVSRRCDGARPVLLTVARLDAAERSKGVDQVIRILPALTMRFPSLRYLVAGTGNDVDRLRQLATDLLVGDTVHFLGHVGDDQLPAILSDADLFVMPSRKEGFGIVFIEAMACGTPVIACGLEGSRDALLDGRVGTLVDPDVPGQVQDAVLAMLTGRCPPELLDGPRLRDEVVAAFGSDRFRELVRESFTTERAS